MRASSVELVAREAARVALAVEPLVVVAHEIADTVAEAAELGQKAVAALRVLLDGRVLVVVERTGLLQDLVGDRELPDVVDEPADRERPQAAARQPELVADLNRAKRDAPRVPFRVLVLLRERDGERAHLRAEEQILGRDELGRRRSPASGRDCAARARSIATAMPITRIPSSSTSWPIHQPSC